ncbi:uncharacterized protein G2W53_026239 [Senna tora]|uniref:Uncharacterized protein n=1 Tax=Senna tora TaxID=362788 RepID=A0A834TNJ0_9FABA|nr:uncharacterized protein G2W53_026239 [Senna tora]
MGGVWNMSSHIPDDKLRLDLRNLHELRGKRLVAQVSQTRRFALYLRTGVVLMLQLESSWHGWSVDHVLTYFRREIPVGSQKPLRITRQKTCCAGESNASVRVVFANRSGFDAPIGVVLAREDRGSCLNIFGKTNRGRISETFTNYEAKDLLRNESNTLVRVVFANRSGFDAPIRVVLAWEERGSCLNLFRTTNCGRILETFTNYEQNTCCASESNASVRVVFANQSGFDAPIGIFLAWKVRGSCLNIFRMTNRGRISETFMNYEAKDLLRKNLHKLRGKRLMAQVSQTRRSALYFANRIGFDAPIGDVLAWEECGSCLNLFRTTNCGRILETFTSYEQNTCCASESNASIRVVFANRSGFDAPIGVFLAWKVRGSCLNIFWRTNRGRVSETLTNYEAKDLLRRSQKPSRITRQKICCATGSNTSVRLVFVNRSGFDDPIGVV